MARRPEPFVLSLVEPPTVSVAGKPTAELVAPGHPLLDAVVNVVRAHRCRPAPPRPAARVRTCLMPTLTSAACYTNLQAQRNPWAGNLR